MSRRFLSHIDLNKNELQNAVMQQLASAPGSPVQGQMYYDTVDDTIYVWDGAAWLDLGVQGGAGATNLGASYAATTVTITSDTGTDVTVVAADTDSAGVMTDAMFDKLDGIEALADVTDAANVDAAGATMNADTTLAGNGYFIDEDSMASDLATKVPSQQSVKAYADTKSTASKVESLTNKTIDANGTGNAISNLEVADFAANVVDTDSTLAANSNTRIPTQAAIKTYVDNGVQGLSWKQAVRAVTAVAGTLATSFENGDIIDGVTLATADRILIKDQASGGENGIYTVNASGAPTRALDVNTAAEILGATVFVSEGTAGADTVWNNTTNAPITLGTTATVWAQVSGGAVPAASTTVAGKVELATDAETNTGTDTTRAITPSNLEAWTGSAQVTTVGTLSSGNATAVVDAASTTVAGKSELATAAEAEARTDAVRSVPPLALANFPVKKIFTIGDAAATQIDVTHSLGTKEVITQVRQASDDAVVECDITNFSTTVVRLNFAVAPASNAIKVVVMG